MDGVLQLLPGDNIQHVEAEGDDRLMAAYARGEARAFDQLYLKYKQPLFGYLLRHCRHEPTAHELFQDVWLRVISARVNYHQRGKFRSWLFTLAHNRLIDYYRRQEVMGTEQEWQEQDSPEGNSPVGQLVSGQERLSLEQALHELPVEQKNAFILREEAGLALKEIAEIQAISVEAAKSRLRYAYQKLRETLQQTESNTT